jgi:hypothetical protein
MEDGAEVSIFAQAAEVDLENSEVLPDYAMIDEELKEESLDTISAITLGDQSTFTEATVLGYKKFSELHLNIQNKLRQSKLLQPEFVDVTNVSYQYAMRKKLRPKRRMAAITKLHASNGISSLFIIKEKYIYTELNFSALEIRYVGILYMEDEKARRRLRNRTTKAFLKYT